MVNCWQSLVLLYCFLALISSAIKRDIVNEVEVNIYGDGKIQSQLQELQESIVRDSDTLLNSNPKLASQTSDSIQIEELAKLDNAKHNDESKFLSIVAIQKELDEIEELISMQEKKIEILSKLRSDFLSLADLHSGIHKQDQSQNKGQPGNIINEDYLSELADALAYESLDQRPSISLEKSSFFVEKSNIKNLQNIVDLRIITLPRHPDIGLIIVAQLDGTVGFYLTPSHELQQIKLSTSGIQSFDIDSEHVPPLLVIAEISSTVKIYSMDLTFNNVSLFHNTPINLSLPRISNYFLQAYQNISLTVEQISDISFKHCKLSKVVASYFAQASRISVCFDDGRIEMYSLNGTSSYETPATSTLAVLSAEKNRLAVGNGTDAIIYLSPRFNQPTRQLICSGSTDDVISIAFDSSRQNYIYVGTTGGDILVYKLDVGEYQNLVANDITCQLILREQMYNYKTRPSPILLNIVAHMGYLYVTDTNRLYVYNCSLNSGTMKSSLTRLYISEKLRHASSSSKNAIPFSISSSSYEHVLMAYETVYQRSSVPISPMVKVYQSLLPVASAMSSYEQIYIMYLFAFIILIIVFQLALRYWTSSANYSLKERNEKFHIHRRFDEQLASIVHKRKMGGSLSFGEEGCWSDS